MNHFETDGLNDLSVDSIEGTPFLTSSVANYLLRPEELEGTCLYDFLSQFTMSRRTKSILEWIKDHPSKNHLGVQASKHIKVPVVNYRDFMNTSSFGNQPIDSIQLPKILEEEHHAMELYAKKANLLFHPFRSVQTDLTVAGSYVRSFQEALCSGIITEAHCEILANIQDCRNSLEAGRPCDSLESETSCPSAACGHGSYNENNAEETNHDDIDSAFEELVETMNELNDSGLQLRTSNNIYQFSSSIIRKCGSAKCGVQNIATPNLGERVGANIFETQSEEMDPDQQHPSGLDDDDFISRYSTFVTKKALHELAISRTERITMDDGHDEIKATGTLKNIQEYAVHHFRGDEDQEYAFEAIMSAFVLRLHDEAAKDTTGQEQMPAFRRRKMNHTRETLQKVNQGSQFISFLSGAGGSGKSHVIKTLVRYAKNLCSNLKVRYDKRTIVVTALTGAAAVGINGETTHMACALNREVTNEPEEWKNAYLLIVDEISFASRDVVDKLDYKLRCILKPDHKFGGIPIVFAGDFTQLKPVKAQPLYLFKDFEKWYEWVHTFLELKTNHRFHLDPPWGNLLSIFRDEGPSDRDVQKINTRVVGSRGGPTESDIPPNVVYATKTNLDRAAINDAIFGKHLENTHSKDPTVQPPLHTVCIKASNLKWRKAGTRSEYINFNKSCEDILYATCGEGHLQGKDNKRYDPLLKLYYGRPLCINENKKVDSCIANGAMCEFKGLVLKQGVTMNDMEKIMIDRFYVWSIKVSQLEGLKVEMLDGGRNQLVILKPETVCQQVQFPLPLLNMTRVRKMMKMTQLPVNVSNARTVHKLQGRSIEFLYISNWDYTGKWNYVCLSRVCEMKGLFLAKPLIAEKCRGMSAECKEFHVCFRNTKHPPPRVHIDDRHSS